MNIFSIPIDNCSREEVLDRVRRFLDEPKFHRIATVNPEFLLRAEKDQEFKEALLRADMRVVDGFGIVLAGLFRGERITRVPGADLMEEILSIANERSLSVYCAVRKDGLSTYEEVHSVILQRYPNVVVTGRDIQTEEIRNCPPARLAVALTKRAGEAGKLEIGNSAIILCNFGVPIQELFLESLRGEAVPSRLAMGIGGAFDFLTGKQRRAPKWLRCLGFEWLWRLILQPKRWKRIWNAIVIFPFRAVFSTMQK